MGAGVAGCGILGMLGGVSGRDMDGVLGGRLEDLRGANLLRSLRRVDSWRGAEVVVAGRALLNFASNDYLGLAGDEAIREAAARGAMEEGAGSGASRLITGSLKAHHELEEALAAFKGTAAALCFSSGHAAALGALPALVGKEDVVILDKLAHACLVDAARLSGVRLRVFRHNDLEDLESKLRWADGLAPEGAGRPNVLVVTESVFSMDGDQAPLAELVALKERFGAWLMVDEAHATGLFGERGAGLIHHLGLASRVEVQMGTLGKALGTAGGFIAGSRALVDFLINRARSFVFSTAPPPGVAVAALAAVAKAQSAEGRALREALWSRVGRLRAGLAGLGRGIPAGAGISAIHPLILGEERAALRGAAALLEAGLLAPAIRFPTVARGSARIRLTLTAAHREEHVDLLLDGIGRVLAEAGDSACAAGGD